jgi:hypothetical protein
MRLSSLTFHGTEPCARGCDVGIDHFPRPPYLILARGLRYDLAPNLRGWVGLPLGGPRKRARGCRIRTAFVRTIMGLRRCLGVIYQAMMAVEVTWTTHG